MKTLIITSACCSILFSSTTRSVASLLPVPTNEVVFADFESDTWGEWQAIGDAFGAGPAHGTLTNQQPVGGFLGRGFVDSFVGGDKSTGTLTSAEFTITRVVYSGAKDLGLGLFASHGAVKIKSLRAWPMGTIWL